MNVERIRAELEKDTKVKVAGLDVDGVLRGKIMNKNKFLSLLKNGEDQAEFGFCGVIYGWDMHDQTYPVELGISNSNNGYADIIAHIDLNTFRRIPWEHNIPFFLCTFLHSDSKNLLYACPRATLQKVCDQLKDTFQLDAYAGAEFEYYNYKETPQSAADKGYQGLTSLTPGMHGYSVIRPSLNQDYFHDLYDLSAAFGVEIEGHHTETGPGVYETALAYTDARSMADQAVLFKLAARHSGMKYGIMPTFMAKPLNNMPGCSGHCHISLRDASGRNIFAAQSERTDAKWPELKFVSRECEHFLAGLLKGLPDIMPCMVPTINGYKRLVENYWAPVDVSWGYESRLGSIRLIGPPTSPDSATRLEVRVPGADMNCHFTLAAIIGLGMYGMREKLELELPPATGESTQSERLPKDLKEATDAMMRPDSLARVILGDDFVNHFGETRLHEWRKYSQTVTNWDLERYMELA